MSILHEVNLLLRKKMFMEAIDILSELVSDAKLYLYNEKYSDALVGIGRIAEAVIFLEKAFKLNPSSIHLPKKIAKLKTLLTANDGIASGVYERNKPVGSQKFIGALLDEVKNFCGVHYRYPDELGQRLMEGGRRCNGFLANNTFDKPLVTVVTVVFNNENTLERCIKSVIAQDYQNIEYIIIDGGSSDGTLNFLKKYEESIDYFISEPDKGIYHAMNKGIELARGSYVCLLNSDDYYDTQFVSKSIAVALERQCSIVFSYYNHGSKLTKTLGINEGIFLGHLNINHSTFLVHRDFYNLVGPYSVDFSIVSDALWMRTAFKMGIRFELLPESLFTFAEDGLSSGNTPAYRELFISEVVKSYKYEFAFLSDDDAREIYLLRFNNKRLDAVYAIYKRYRNQPLFIKSLSGYIEYCFRMRDNFSLSHTESDGLFPVYIKFCESLDISKSAIRISTKHGCFSHLIQVIDDLVANRKVKFTKTILHFVSVFSAPSETFIYDLLTRLENDTAFDNFLLFEHHQLADERPFKNSFWIPWGDFRSEVRNAIYKYIFTTLQPDVVVSHFALNSWKLDQRLKPLDIQIPMISMTHGIDVFMLKNEGDYRDYILKDFVPREDTYFSSVSSFLKGRLIDYGVPQTKISLIHNSVNPRFQAHRKTCGYRLKDQPVKMLAVGRLIDWKGHRYLIEALASVKERVSESLLLTIVFGNGRDLYDDITAQIKTLDLENNVELVPFIDFSKNPDFYSTFDLFVHPSTYSDDDLQRTETFGVSVLEAIASGLPVVATDAGGIPEVIGISNKFARIVPHANVGAMADAIVSMVCDLSCFSDNSIYAEQRLSLFSEKSQIIQLSKLIYQITKDKARAAIFSTSTIQGAGYAAYRLHRGLLESDCISSEIFTTVRNHEMNLGVQRIEHPSGDGKRWNILQNQSISKPNLTIFTVNYPTVENRLLANWVKNVDVINIHWVARFLSIENIAFLTRLNKPVVITIRDMNPITGGCHFFHGCEEWTRSCECCPQLVDTWGNFPAKVINAKRKYYDFSNVTLVALSLHTAEIIRRAPHFCDCRLEVILNSIETDVFAPINKQSAREILGLPQNRKIIGYIPSFSSEVKGYNEILEAFQKLMTLDPELNPFVLLVGNKTPATDAISFDKHCLGYITDNKKLALAYSAADVIVVPSLEETFSNTTAEAISCGTPVVGFKTGAIPEMVLDDITGYTFAVGDVDGLVQGISKVLSGPDLSLNCRRFSEKNLQFNLQSARYENLFMELIQYNKNRGGDIVGVENYFKETTPTVIRLLESSYKP